MQAGDGVVVGLAQEGDSPALPVVWWAAVWGIEQEWSDEGEGGGRGREAGVTGDVGNEGIHGWRLEGGVFILVRTAWVRGVRREEWAGPTLNED